MHKLRDRQTNKISPTAKVHQTYLLLHNDGICENPEWRSQLNPASSYQQSPDAFSSHPDAQDAPGGVTIYQLPVDLEK